MFTFKALLLLNKAFTFSPKLRTLKCYPFVKPHFKFFSTSSSDPPHSFAVSYLINNLGFSPESALKASLYLRFNNPRKPDSVLSFFRSLGFSNPQIRHIVGIDPRVLSYDLHKVLLPKIEFLRSKGASTSDIIRIVNASPRFLLRNLENHIIPTYELLKGFLHSDRLIIARLNFYSFIVTEYCVPHNIKLLLDNGLTHSGIAMLLCTRPKILCSNGLLSTVEELKQMGFDSSTSTFAIALTAKKTVNKVKWAEKVETFKKWGWSEEQVLVAFRRQPSCMLASTDKIDAVLGFWVNQLGFESLDLVKAPKLFTLSLEKRIIPRASVLQFLILKGLRKKDASPGSPYLLSEKSFLDKFVKRFKEHSSHLSKLYEDKLNLASGN